MLHYEFPPYATNEIGRPGAVGRREYGHGMFKLSFFFLNLFASCCLFVCLFSWFFFARQ
jgi:hypothetical protein